MDQVTVHQIISVLAVLLGGGVGVALVSQFLKKTIGLKADAVIHGMVILLSVITSVAQYVFTLKNLPVEILGISSVSIYGFSQALYKFSIYASDFIVRVKTKEDATAVPNTPPAAPTLVSPTPAEQTTNTDF